MRQSEPTQSALWIKKLQERPRVDELDTLAVRFVFSLRLIAIHRQAKRDPVPELAAKLGNITSAIAALDLVETLTSVWPEPIQVGRACCRGLTLDEVTLGRAVQAVSARDREGFSLQLDGLIKASRVDILWEQALTFVAAEFAAG
ncbi:DNA-directed RNA polymerase subunit beta' [Erythrobacter sp. HA6-11]